MARLPMSIQAIESSCCVNVPTQKRNTIYSSWMWILTFLTYCSYHLSRKPISVVKNVLNQNCSGVTPTPPGPVDPHWCDWKPFDQDNSATLLGTIDSAFLFAYAFGMFISGLVAERIDLRYFLSFGMILSGIFCCMFGLGYTLKVHHMWFYVLAQVLSGFFQTTGWPGVVTALGNWFGKSKRGLIFGIWNSHTSLGNILGTLIAAAFVTQNWALSFIIPGMIIAAMGIVVLFFMVPEPMMVGLPNPNLKKELERVSPPPRRRNSPDDSHASHDESAALLDDDTPVVSYVEREKETESELIIPQGDGDKAIGFVAALAIPGVVEFSLCLFFAKLVSYTFLYWLPNYILNNTSYSAEQSANLSTFFDVGGIVGGILAGIISDYSGMSASTCSVMLIIAIPMYATYALDVALLLLVGIIVNGPYSLITTAVSDLGTHPVIEGNAKVLATVSTIIDGTGSMMFVYETFSDTSLGVNITLLTLVGVLVNGPYALITTAVSADLGTHESLQGNAKALATVTAIIDGTGSIGAAVGPLIAGPISALDWNYVFYMLMAADVLALLLLIRLVVHEVKHFLRQRRRNNLNIL